MTTGLFADERERLRNELQRNGATELAVLDDFGDTASEAVQELLDAAREIGMSPYEIRVTVVMGSARIELIRD